MVSVLSRLQKHDEDIAAIQRGMRELEQDMKRQSDKFNDLTRVVEHLYHEMQRGNDKAESERRIMVLEIENRFLRHERGLPSGEPPKPPQSNTQ